MFSLFIFSLKNSFRKKVVAFLAILGVGVGVSLMVFILSSSAGVNKIFSESFTKAAGEITISGESAPMGFGISGGEATLIPKSYIERIEKIEHIKSVSPRVMTIISSKSLKTPDSFSIVVGVDSKRDKKNEGPTTFIYEGRSFSDKNEVIIGKVIEQSIKMADGEGIKIGDKIKIMLPPKKENRISQEIELEIVGKFETGNFLEDYYIFTSEETVREIAGVSQDQINSIVAKVDSIENIKKVEEEIKKEFENADPPVQVLLNKDIFSNLERTINTFSQFRMAISVVSGIAGGMCILIVMLISVIERKKEFGLLKAIGWSNKNIFFSILIESLILSLVGVSLGLFFGWAGIITSGYYMEILQEVLYLNWKVIILVLGFGVVIGIVGGVYPAWKALRVVPMETLKGN